MLMYYYTVITDIQCKVGPTCKKKYLIKIQIDQLDNLTKDVKSLYTLYHSFLLHYYLFFLLSVLGRPEVPLNPRIALLVMMLYCFLYMTLKLKLVL